MLLAVTTDSHFTEVEFTNQLKFYREQFFPYMLDNNITTWIEMGDFTDKRQYISGLLMYRLLNEFFPLLDEFGITEAILLVGNHQMYYKETRKVHNLEAFKHIPQVNVIEEPTFIDFDGTYTLLQPWMVHGEKIEVGNNTSLVLGHLEIKGAMMTKSFESSSGLDRATFKDVPTYSGHFHIRQGNYFGNPYQKDWGDFGENKGFHVIDTDDLDNPTFIQNKKSIRHIKVDVNIVEGVPTAHIYDGIALDEYIEVRHTVNKSHLKIWLTGHKVKITIASEVKLITDIKRFLTIIEVDVKPAKLQTIILVEDTKDDGVEPTPESEIQYVDNVSDLLLSLYDGDKKDMLADIIEEATNKKGEL